MGDSSPVSNQQGPLMAKGILPPSSPAAWTRLDASPLHIPLGQLRAASSSHGTRGPLSTQTARCGLRLCSASQWTGGSGDSVLWESK